MWRFERDPLGMINGEGVITGTVAAASRNQKVYS